MKKPLRKVAVLILVTMVFILTPLVMIRALGVGTEGSSSSAISLPEPRREMSDLAQAIFSRRSVRSFADRPISHADVSDILWSTIGITVDGITGPTRAAPSAGATNPLMIYLFVRDVDGLNPGVYRYHNVEHSLELISSEDRSIELRRAALNQFAITRAQANIVIAADYEKTMDRYAVRGITYVHIEAGHAAQNAALMAESLGLGSVMIGAFSDGMVQNLLESRVASPLLIIPIGSR